MKGFISQLKEAEKNFFELIKNNGFTFKKREIVYMICDGYIKMSLECRDVDGFYIEAFAYCRTDNESLHQSKIDLEGIFLRRP